MNEDKMSIDFDALRKETHLYFRGKKYTIKDTPDRAQGFKKAEDMARSLGWNGGQN